MNKKWIIISLVSVSVIAILTCLYFLLFHISKEKAVEIITTLKPDRNKDMLYAMDEEYLISWAKAINGGESTFVYNAKNYSTESGRLM